MTAKHEYKLWLSLKGPGLSPFVIGEWEGLEDASIPTKRFNDIVSLFLPFSSDLSRSIKATLDLEQDPYGTEFTDILSQDICSFDNPLDAYLWVVCLSECLFPGQRYCNWEVQ